MLNNSLVFGCPGGDPHVERVHVTLLNGVTGRGFLSSPILQTSLMAYLLTCLQDGCWWSSLTGTLQKFLLTP